MPLDLIKKEGAIACANGVVVGDNPYDPISEEKQHWAWMEGWVDMGRYCNNIKRSSYEH